MKTNELTGATLDWAVAMIEFPEPGYEEADRLVYVRGDSDFHFSPSTNWAQGGPIIERDGIAVDCKRNDNGKIEEWEAYNEAAGDENWDANVSYGPTPLIASMRCYVSTKLGNEVEVPDELLEFA